MYWQITGPLGSLKCIRAAWMCPWAGLSSRWGPRELFILWIVSVHIYSTGIKTEKFKYLYQFIKIIVINSLHVLAQITMFVKKKACIDMYTIVRGVALCYIPSAWWPQWGWMSWALLVLGACGFTCHPGIPSAQTPVHWKRQSPS